MEHENDNGSEFTFTDQEIVRGALFYRLIAQVAGEMAGFVLGADSGFVHASVGTMRCIILIADLMQRDGKPVPAVVVAELHRLAKEAEEKSDARAAARAPHRVSVRVPNNGRVQ